MLNFEFVSPTKIYFGQGQISKLSEIFTDRRYHKVLLHYGKSSIKKNGLYDEICRILQETKTDYIEVGQVEANPKLPLVEKTVELCRKNNVDFILAVGGGSVIDSAKAIASGVFIDESPWQFCLHNRKVDRALPIGVVLTISAAGSELSNSCVITNPDNKLKRGFNSDLLRPVWAIMDPTYTYTVSPYQTACGIVDIMMHTLERYLTDTEDNELVLAMSEGLLKSVMQAGKKAIEEPCDYQARATLMLASSLSHNGLTGLGLRMYFTVHKIEHELTGAYDNISHGLGLAILFPAWARYVYPFARKRFERLFINVLGIDKNLPSDDLILSGIEQLEQYFSCLGLATKLSDVGVSKDMLLTMALKATNHGQNKISGFKELDADDLVNILELAF